MRFRYSTTDPTQSELDSRPRLPLVLRHGKQIVHAVGLVDNGATVNVLPYRFGIQLGAVWNDQKAARGLLAAQKNQPSNRQSTRRR